MKVTVRKDRNLIIVNARNTQNENDVETIEITVPEEYEDFNKKIAFITDDGVVWDFIENNKYTLTNAITKYKKVKFYIWLTQDNKDFRSEERTIVFNKNQDANEEVTEEEISGFNKMINILEEEITEVTGLQEDLTNLINTVQTKLDNGDFVGPQGPQGEPGESYDDTEIKEEISDIKEEQTTQNTRIEELEEQVQELESNQLTGTATGQSIYLSDSADSRVRNIGLSGNSEQESTTGKNLGNTDILASYNNPTVINVSENGFTVDLSKGNFGLLVGKDIMFGNLDGSKQYTISYHLKQNNTTFLPGLRFKYSDGTFTTKSLSTLEGDVSITSTDGKTITAIEPTFSTQSSGGLAVFSNIQLEEGSTATPYEPYTGGQASPNPSYPQEIHNTGDNVNIFDLKGFLADRGVRYTENSDGSLTFAAETVLYSQPLQFSQEDITVSLSGLITNNSTNNARIHLLNSSNTNVGDIREGTNKLENVSACKIRLDWVSSGTVTMKNIKLEQDSIATPYSPYGCGNVNEKVSNSDGTQEQNISFPLAQGQKLMEGDYLADDGVHHVRGEIDLKNLTWTYTSDGNRFLCNNVSNLNIKGAVSDSQPSTQILSNIFTVRSNNGLASVSNPVNYGIAITTTGLIRAKYTDTTDVNTFVTMLTNTNAILQYELAEEVIDPYTEEQQAVWEQIKALRTYKPITHISSTDEVPATVDVTYVKDLETVINNLGGA